MKKTLIILLMLAMVFSFAACTPAETNEPPVEEQPKVEPVTIMIAAAASLETAYVDSLIPLFEQKYDYITVEGTYDSSGKLQTQIEEGLAADVFMSASTKQMNALVEKGLINKADVNDLLLNEVVLIESVTAPTGITSFADVLKAKVIAIGDPESVPAGQYASEIFTSLGIINDVLAKASLGTNVTEVLNWVAEGSANVGVVYSTDAAKMADKVTVIATAPEGSLATPIIYPVAVTANSTHREAAQLFVDFLKSAEAMSVFESYGFQAAK